MSKRVLFVYWHGLGDNILATPAIRKYKQTTGNFVGWAMLRRFQPAELFKQNPYVDRVHWTSDAWNDFESYAVGRKKVVQEAAAIAAKHGYDELKVIGHQNRKCSKILCTADEMGVALGGDVHTEVYYKPEALRPFFKTIPIPAEYVFFHGITGFPPKDWPQKSGRAWLRRQKIEIPIVSSDAWAHTKVPIAFAMEVMRKAKYIVVADSVMYHAAHAMDLKIDLAYFERGIGVWRRVHPLHAGRETIIYSLAELE